jgi:hypothetical protein
VPTKSRMGRSYWSNFLCSVRWWARRRKSRFSVHSRSDNRIIDWSTSGCQCPAETGAGRAMMSDRVAWVADRSCNVCGLAQLAPVSRSRDGMIAFSRVMGDVSESVKVLTSGGRS